MLFLNASYTEVSKLLNGKASLWWFSQSGVRNTSVVGKPTLNM